MRDDLQIAVLAYIAMLLVIFLFGIIGKPWKP